MKKINVPCRDEALDLKAGDMVELTGKIYCGRDAVLPHVVKMAEELYAGKIAAEPLAAGRKQETHCRFCDYRNVCRRQE